MINRDGEKKEIKEAEEWEEKDEYVLEKNER